MERIIALRKKVDEIDGKILYLLKERVEICKSIGAVKREHGIPVRDHQRESKVYSNIMRNASELELNPHEIKAVYQEIMAMCSRVQESDIKT